MAWRGKARQGKDIIMGAVSKGTKYEREVLEMFKKNGYSVMRTARSHGPYDVIAIKQSPQNKKICFVAFVQCKIKKR